MPVWLSIVLGIIGAIGTICGIFGFSAYMNERAKRKAQEKNKAEEHIEELQHKEYEDTLRKIIREENKEINDKLGQIETNLALNTKGTVTILRNDMKKSLDKCRERGFASTGDKANWVELYNTYSDLGGNHFKEYVNGWKKELEDLPIKPKAKRKLNEVNK